MHTIIYLVIAISEAIVVGNILADMIYDHTIYRGKRFHVDGLSQDNSPAIDRNLYRREQVRYDAI